MKKTILPALFMVLLLGPNAFSSEPSWPKMKEFEDSFIVDIRAPKIEYLRALSDINGVVQYVLVCEGGSERYLDELERQKGITYVGPLGCRLSEGDKEEEYSLLAEDEVAPWHTRGQYRYEEIIGDCGKYPEYGSIRHFRLRGFELTLSALDPTFSSSNQLASFRMQVFLRRDDSITSKQAEQTGYLPPGGDCKKVRKGNLPRMCRNRETGSWESCKD